MLEGIQKETQLWHPSSVRPLIKSRVYNYHQAVETAETSSRVYKEAVECRNKHWGAEASRRVWKQAAGYRNKQ